MDGYEVCRALRQQEAFRKTAIIAQTGWGQERDKAMASEAGFDHHIVKPVGLDKLEQLLAGVEREGALTSARLQPTPDIRRQSRLDMQPRFVLGDAVEQRPNTGKGIAADGLPTVNIRRRRLCNDAP